MEGNSILKEYKSFIRVLFGPDPILDLNFQAWYHY